VGTMLLAQGKLVAARRELERALVTASDTRPGDRGLVLAALCDVHRQLLDRATARAHCAQAIDVLAGAFGPAHPQLAHTYSVWGALELDDGKPDAARSQLDRGLAALAHGDRLATRAWLDAQLGTALHALHQPGRAVAPLERAVAYYEREPDDRYLAGGARFQLARTLWALGNHRRAVTLATAARDDLAAATGADLDARRAEVAQWLAAHR
jgi:tetratricopeptide (TPR) repeat protein